MGAKIKQFFSSLKTNDAGIQYAIDVVYSNKYVTSAYVKKACMRHLLFFYKGQNEPEFPFYYDSKQVRICYKFFELNIIPESGKPFILHPYRAFILSAVIGGRYKSNCLKLITQELMDTEARKNGKSTFYAIFANYVAAGFLHDGLPKVFISGAGDKSSKILYTLSQDLIRRNPVMRREFNKVNRDITKHNNGGEIVKLPFEKSAIEGQNPTLGILTEFHLHPDNRMQESFRTAINESRPNQLIIYDTTKGQNLSFPYFEQEKTFKRFLDEQINNPEKLSNNYHVFLFCAELDEDKYSEGDNPHGGQQANPAIGVTLSLDSMQRQFNQLVNKVDLVDFKIKKIGMGVNQSGAYFEMSSIVESQKANQAIYDEGFTHSQRYKELTCILGIDLSNVRDTTAVVATFEIPQPDGESVGIIKHLGFIPEFEKQNREHFDKIPYSAGIDSRGCRTTKGDVIDYNDISDYISELAKTFNIQRICYDRGGFHYLENKIKEKMGVRDEDLIPVKQGMALSPAIKEFERKLRLKKIYIADDNQMFINHLLNIAIRQTQNTNDNFIPEKIDYNARIDGAIAAFTALFERINMKAIKSQNLNFSVVY